MVDEADIDLVGGGSTGGNSPMRGQKRMLDSPIGSPKAKRKPGPLPKDFPVWRPQSPSPLSPTLSNITPDTHITPISAPSDSDDDIYIIERDRPPPTLSKLNLFFLYFMRLLFLQRFFTYYVKVLYLSLNSVSF